MSDRAALAIRERLAGKKLGRAATALLFAGPAVVASIAYMDPGNFATNIQAGAAYGYSLLWVVLLANLAAMLFQALSAKLGIVTGRNLAEHCREQFPAAVVSAHVGRERDRRHGDGSRRIHRRRHRLLAAVPRAAAGRHGRRGGRSPTRFCRSSAAASGRWSLSIGALVAVIGALLPRGSLHRADRLGARRRRVSWFRNSPTASALTLAVGIIGATVMPHAIYLHSALTQARPAARDDRERATLLRFSNREV